MYVETVPNRNSRPAVLLREGWREGERVRKRTLATSPTGPQRRSTPCAESSRPAPRQPRRRLRHRTLPPPRPRRRPARHDRRLGLDPAYRPKRSPERDRVLAMVVQRLLHPASKLATPTAWHATTLAQALDLGDADEDALYEAMDWLLARQERIERRLAQRHLHEGAPGVRRRERELLRGAHLSADALWLQPRRQARQAPGRLYRPERCGRMPGGGPSLSGQHRRPPTRRRPSREAGASTSDSNGWCWSATGAC